MSQSNKQIASTFDDMDKSAEGATAEVKKLLNQAQNDFGDKEFNAYWRMIAFLMSKKSIAFQTVLDSRHMSYLYDRDKEKVAQIIDICIYNLPDNEVAEAIEYVLGGRFAVELAQHHPNIYADLIHTCFNKTPDVSKKGLFSHSPENHKISDDFVVRPKIGENLPAVILVSKEQFNGSAGYSTFYGRIISHIYTQTALGVANASTLEKITAPDFRNGRHLDFPSSSKTLENLLAAIREVEPENPCLSKSGATAQSSAPAPAPA